MKLKKNLESLTFANKRHQHTHSHIDISERSFILSKMPAPSALGEMIEQQQQNDIIWWHQCLHLSNFYCSHFIFPKRERLIFISSIFFSLFSGLYLQETQSLMSRAEIAVWTPSDDKLSEARIPSTQTNDLCLCMSRATARPTTPKPEQPRRESLEFARMQLPFCIRWIQVVLDSTTTTKSANVNSDSFHECVVAVVCIPGKCEFNWFNKSRERERERCAACKLHKYPQRQM